MLMCFVCEHCGFKDAEIKPSGEIPPKGKKTTIRVTRANAADYLQRDLLKSADAYVARH